MMTNIKLLFKSLCYMVKVVFCWAAALILRGMQTLFFGRRCMA